MAKVAGTYVVELDPTADDELDRLKPFEARSILEAIRQLRYEAEIATRNRKPLRSVIVSVPEASWELRVGDYRVLYAVRNRRLVRLLRVIFKGRLTMNEAVDGSRRE